MRVLIGLAIFVAVAIGVVLVAGAVAKARLRASSPAPGKLIDVGGHKLHLYCLGRGSQTVVMESGLGGSVLDWALVYPEVAKTTRVCAYDRAGFGWSDPSPKPRTAEIMVEELHSLLRAGGIKPPYVLVGHSFGGVLVRLYAYRFPTEVAGMVLVDSSHEDQFRRFPEAYRRAGEQLNVLVQRQLRLARSLTALGVLALKPDLFPVHPKLPEATASTYRATIVSDPSHIDGVLAEYANVEQNLAQARLAGMKSLGTIPLVVLVHGHPDPLPPQANMTQEALAEGEQVWRTLQEELSKLSAKGRLSVAQQSGHYIQLDRPDLVITAIREVLKAVTTRGSAARGGQ